jgi:hypothetical protein
MAVVLATQIQLTDEEKREAVEKLKSAYQKKMDQQAQAANEALNKTTPQPPKK